MHTSLTRPISIEMFSVSPQSRSSISPVHTRSRPGLGLVHRAFPLTNAKKDCFAVYSVFSVFFVLFLFLFFSNNLSAFWDDYYIEHFCRRLYANNALLSSSNVADSDGP